MINSIKILILIIGLATIFSCKKDEGLKKDEDLKKHENSVTIDGVNFGVSKGIMLGVSMDDIGHTGITLISSGTASDAKTLNIDIANFKRENVPGTYFFPKQQDKGILNSHLTNCMYYKDGTMTVINLQKGSVTIIHNVDDNYTISIDLVMVNGMVFKGTYSGDFQVKFQNG